jgi:hypothetical protein
VRPIRALPPRPRRRLGRTVRGRRLGRVPRLVEVDLWALNATVDQAATAVEPAQHAAALRRVIDLYTGAVADGHNWLWLA